MKLKGKPHASANFVLSCEENKKLATFVELLLIVDRRVKAQAAVGKKQRVTKAKHEKKGSQKKAGPFFTSGGFIAMLYLESWINIARYDQCHAIVVLPS